MFQRNRRPEPDTIEVVIGPRATFSGDLRCDASIRIDGIMTGGSIETLGNVILTEGCQVRGEIQARTVSVRGAFQGSIRADRAELLDGCHVTGTVYVNTVYIDDGAVLNGVVRMQKDARGFATGEDGPSPIPVIK